MPRDSKPFDEEDEQTSVKIDLNPDAPAAAPSPAPSLDDDEDEPTKVLDWDRAMKKSLEREEPASPATGGAQRAEHLEDQKK